MELQGSDEVCEGISDTHAIAGSDIYMAYLSFYQNVKQAARRGGVGSDAIYQNLRRFSSPRRGNGPRLATSRLLFGRFGDLGVNGFG